VFPATNEEKIVDKQKNGQDNIIFFISYGANE